MDPKSSLKISLIAGSMLTVGIVAGALGVNFINANSNNKNVVTTEPQKSEVKTQVDTPIQTPKVAAEPVVEPEQKSSDKTTAQNTVKGDVLDPNEADKLSTSTTQEKDRLNLDTANAKAVDYYNIAKLASKEPDKFKLIATLRKEGKTCLGASLMLKADTLLDDGSVDETVISEIKKFEKFKDFVAKNCESADYYISIVNNIMPAVPKSVKTIEEFNTLANISGMDLKALVKANLKLLSGSWTKDVIDEFGQKSGQKTCAFYEVPQTVQLLIGADKIKNGMYHHFNQVVNAEEKGQYDTGDLVQILAFIKSYVQTSISKGDIPATISFSGEEMNIVGRDFKQSFDGYSIYSKLYSYLYPPKKALNQNRMLLLMAATGGYNTTIKCDYVNIDSYSIEKILKAKKPLLLKFLGQLLAGDEAAATKVLMEDPKTRDMFEYLKN